MLKLNQMSCLKQIVSKNWIVKVVHPICYLVTTIKKQFQNLCWKWEKFNERTVYDVTIFEKWQFPENLNSGFDQGHMWKFQRDFLVKLENILIPCKGRCRGEINRFLLNDLVYIPLSHFCIYPGHTTFANQGRDIYKSVIKGYRT